jgi:preprotein translocase subunit Sec63
MYAEPSTMTHFDSRSTAISALGVLELRLTRAPHEILMIRRDASNSEACAAFIELSAIYHPRRFAEFGEHLLRRAERAHRQLREALRAFAATERPSYTARRSGSMGITRSR